MRRTLLMSRTLLVSCAVVVAVGLMSAGRPASAAVINSISYDITGGMYGGLYPAFAGPITGVSVTYTPPGGSVSTPFSCGGSCGTMKIVRTGPSAPHTSFTVFVSRAVINPTRFAAFSYDFYSTFYGNPSVFVYVAVGATSGVGAGITYAFPLTSFTIFTIGNEIRLPEPSTQVGLASGLVLLGALVALRTRRRARLH